MVGGDLQRDDGGFVYRVNRRHEPHPVHALVDRLDARGPLHRPRRGRARRRRRRTARGRDPGHRPSAMKPVQWALTSARERGVATTAKVAGTVLVDLFFDWRYRTDTMGWVERDALDTASANKAHSASYSATKARPLSRLMRSLSLPRDGTFVDIGSGKGRVLLIASRLGFARWSGSSLPPPRPAGACERRDVREQTAAPVTGRDRRGRRDDVSVRSRRARLLPLQPLRRRRARAGPGEPRPVAQGLSEDDLADLQHPLHDDVVRASSLFTHGAYYEIGGNRFRVTRTSAGDSRSRRSPTRLGTVGG